MNSNTIIWVCSFVIVAIAVALRVGWRPSRPRVHWGWIATVLGVLLMGLLVYGGCRSGKTKNEEPPTASETMQPVMIKVGKEKTLHRFATDGCLTVFLRGDWTDYPKGGKISFTSLETGRVVLYDEPGKNSNSSLPAGNYRICKEDPDAWGVEIWQ